MTLCICLILLCIWVCAGASLCVCACLCVCVCLSYCEREAHTERSPLLSSQSPPWEGPGAPRRDCWLCSCRCAAVNFLMQGGGAKRGSGGKGRVTLLITTETAGPWSPNSQRGLREAVPAHGSEPRTRLSFLLGEPVQGLCLQARAPQLRAGSLGEGVLKDFPCAASDFVLGFYSPGLAQPQ